MDDRRQTTDDGRYTAHDVVVRRLSSVVLLTGFEPFDGRGLNPSWEAARSLDGEVIGGLRIVARQLPVDWERSWRTLLAAIDETAPGYVLMLGEAARRTCISVETVAHNACGDKIDNAGSTLDGGQAVPGGEAELPVTMPVEVIVDNIERSSVPVVRSV